MSSSAKRVGRKITGSRKRPKKAPAKWHRGILGGGRLRPRRMSVADVGRYGNQLGRAEIDALNESLARVGEGPMTAEDIAILGKMQVARLFGLPPDDPDADEFALFLEETERMAAAATWPARDDTVAARVRKRRRS